MGQDIARTQKCLLEMAKKIKDIFEEYNIKYSIAFGTLIGAVRHHGFIPWDDDFDFIIFKDQYDKTVKVLRENLPENMFLEDSYSEPLYFHAWPHVKDINSIASRDLYPNDGLYAHKGLSIDLYVADIVDEREVELLSLKENLEYNKRMLHAGVINKEGFLAFQEKIEKDILGEEERMRSFPPGNKQLFMALPKRYRQISMQDFFPLKRYTFDSVCFWGPNDFDSILRKIYGDYMQFPPPEQRKPHYDEVIFL